MIGGQQRQCSSLIGAADPDQDLPDARGARLHPLPLPRHLGAGAPGGGQPRRGLEGQVWGGEPGRGLIRV